MKKNLLLFFFISNLATSHEFEDFRWLVKVRSTFKDSLNESQNYVEVGYGFIVQAYEKYFVITAKHLSLGGIEENQPNLKIDYYDLNSKNFQPLQIVSRHCAISSDIEIIEIEKIDAVEELASLGQPYNFEGQDPDQLYLTPKWQVHFSKAHQTGMAEGFTALGFRSFIPKSEVLSKNTRSPLENFHDLISFKENHKDDSQDFIPIAEHGFYEHGHEIVSYTKGYPGMSGLPLIYKPYIYKPQRAHEEDWKIHGIYSAGSETFQKSWYAKISGGLKAIHKNYSPNPFINGSIKYKQARKPINQTPTIHIRAHKGAVYRVGKAPVLEDDKHIPGQTVTYHISDELYFQEAILVGSNANSNFGQRKSLGNITRIDSGNGSRADGGNGTRSDGGTSNTVIASQSFSDAGMILKLVKYKADGFLDIAWNWAFGKKQEKIEVADDPIIAFETGYLLLAANTTNLLWLIEEVRTPNGFRYGFDYESFKKISINSTEISYKIWDKLKKVFHPSIYHLNSPVIEEDASLSFIFKGRDLKSTDPFKIHSADINVRYDENLRNLYFRIKLPDDSVEFVLGPSGALIPYEIHYKPEIQVVSHRGVKHRIDLDSFVFESKDGYTGRPGPYTLQPSQNYRTLSLVSEEHEYLMSGDYAYSRDD